MAGSTSISSLQTSIFNADLYREVLSLWFDGSVNDVIRAEPEQLKRWYGFGDEASKRAFDGLCQTVSAKALEAVAPSSFLIPEFVSHEVDRENAEQLSKPFRDNLAAARKSGMDLVDATLALIILLDQMPRNCFRGAVGRSWYTPITTGYPGL